MFLPYQLAHFTQMSLFSPTHDFQRRFSLCFSPMTLRLKPNVMQWQLSVGSLDIRLPNPLITIHFPIRFHVDMFILYKTNVRNFADFSAMGFESGVALETLSGIITLTSLKLMEIY